MILEPKEVLLYSILWEKNLFTYKWTNAEWNLLAWVHVADQLINITVIGIDEVPIVSDKHCIYSNLSVFSLD